MKVSSLMKPNPTTINKDETISQASKLFKDKRIRHLPVVNDSDVLVGIVTDRDLKRASASDATLLEVHELLYLLNKVKVSQIMSKKVVSVGPDADIKAAAGLLVQHKIGGLPVVQGKKLLGIITDTDLLAHLANS